MIRSLLILALLVRVAHADDDTDTDRALVTARIAVLGGAYLVAEFGFNDQLSPAHCRWCYPDGFDAGARNLLKWSNTTLANDFANAAGYVMTPLAATSLLAIAGWGHGWRRTFDDISPVIEAAIVASLFQHVMKVTGGRERPDIHYGGPHVHNDEDNVSFWSGHTSLAFSLAVSAGSVASIRGYSEAPLIWATTLSLAAATGYLRIAADRHYATDVLTGAAVGTIIGYIWPRYVRRHIRADVTPNGVAVAGSF
jgi:membrane-associated phospholipid phosphatase